MGGHAFAMIRVALLVVGFTSGCMLSPIGPTVDGWAIGDPVDCTRHEECDEFITAAINAFDRRDPGHRPIAEVRLHDQGRPGAPILHTCSGGCAVVAVFRLVDGSVRAIGVATPGIETTPMTFDYGPGSANRFGPNPRRHPRTLAA